MVANTLGNKSTVDEFIVARCTFDQDKPADA